MTYPEISLGEILLVGIEIRINNSQTPEMGELWQKFYANSVQDRIPNCIDSRLFGLYSDYENGHTGDYSFMIGCPVDELSQLPQGMVGKRIPAQTYQVARAEGALPDALIETWQDIGNSDIPRAFSFDFEIYDDRAADPAAAEVDIFVARREPG